MSVQFLLAYYGSAILVWGMFVGIIYSLERMEDDHK